MLLHTAGIVMFTLLVNATTMKKLLEKLGMSDISDSKKIAMANAVRQIRDSNHRTLTMLKSDRFLADADWSLAEKVCEIHNPYVEVEEGKVGGGTGVRCLNSNDKDCRPFPMKGYYT